MYSCFAYLFIIIKFYILFIEIITDLPDLDLTGKKLSIHQSIHPYIFHSFYLNIHPFIYLFIYVSIFFSTKHISWLH